MTTDLLMIKFPANTHLCPTNFVGAVAKSQTDLAAIHWEFAGNIPSIKDRGSIKESIPFKTKCLPTQVIGNSPPVQRKNKILPSCVR